MDHDFHDDRNVVLVREEAPASGGHFVVCRLHESDDAIQPWRLQTSRVEAIPQHLERYAIRGLPPHLEQRDGHSVDVIVSTGSGTGKAQGVWQHVLAPLLEVAATGRPCGDAAERDQKTVAQAPRCGLLVTDSIRSVRRFAELRLGDKSSAAAAATGTIILLSGDGGIVDLLNGHGGGSGPSTYAVALLPLGTGNALFHSSHRPLYDDDPCLSPLVAGLRTLFHGTAVQLPSFRADFSPGARLVAASSSGSPSPVIGGDEADDEEKEKVTDDMPPPSSLSHLHGAIVASYGFHASIIYESDTPQYRRHGDKRFAMVAQELLRDPHSYAARLLVRRPGVDRGGPLVPLARQRHAYVLATLVSSLERTFTISPTSRPLDGKLRLLHFGPVGARRIMDVMMAAYDDGKHVGLRWDDDGDEVAYEEVDELRLEVGENEPDRWRNVCIDGTIVQLPPGGSMSVRKAERPSLRILVDPRVLPPA